MKKYIPPFIIIKPIIYWKVYKKMLKTRKGKCIKCGKCCQLCKYYSKEKGCRINIIKPLICRLYPTIVDGCKLYDGCGFYWDKEDNKWAEEWLTKYRKTNSNNLK